MSLKLKRGRKVYNRSMRLSEVGDRMRTRHERGYVEKWQTRELRRCMFDITRCKHSRPRKRDTIGSGITSGPSRVR